jgi:hypothetical protein
MKWLTNLWWNTLTKITLWKIRRALNRSFQNNDPLAQFLKEKEQLLENEFYYPNISNV